MKSQKQTSNLVGCKVLIDWPVRWKTMDHEKFRASAKKEAEAKESYFGFTGEIMATFPMDERGRTLTVMLTGGFQGTGLEGGEKSAALTGTLVDLYQGAVTITELPKGNDEVVDLLKQILKAIEVRK